MNLKPKFDVKRSAMQLCDEKSSAKTFTEKEKDPEKNRLRKAINAELQLLCTQRHHFCYSKRRPGIDIS